MKKILLLIIATVLFVSPFVAATTMTASDKTQSQRTMPSTTSAFTHNVFIEEGGSTWCPSCPYAEQALFSIYNSSDYPFYYVALVYDQTKLGKDRMWWHYSEHSTPTIFLDGGFSQKVGRASTPQLTEQLYRPLIEEAGAREIHPLVVTTNVTGHGNAKLDITVTVKNTGTKPYVGILRSYVTEIVSRWMTQNGHPFHFGLLGYAIKKIIFVSPQKTQTYTATFDGNAKQGNLTFPDIVDSNIMVISTLCHWQPHVVAEETNPTDPNQVYVGTHLAFYIDQTIGATVQ